MTEREEGPEAESAAAAPEAELLRHRRENLDRLASLGLEIAPLEFPIDATVTEIGRTHRERAAEELESLHVSVATAGRVLALRTAGKAGFLDLSDGRSRLQVYVRRDAVGDAGFELYRSIDLGDWLGV